jgi:hypothetical protein
LSASAAWVACGRLRSLDPDRPMRIIAITDWRQEADRARSRSGGGRAPRQAKPVDPETLTRLIAGNNGGHTLH